MRGNKAMQTVQEIERAIGTLSPREVEELQSWMDERFSQPIDAQTWCGIACQGS